MMPEMPVYRQRGDQMHVPVGNPRRDPHLHRVRDPETMRHFGAIRILFAEKVD